MLGYGFGFVMTWLVVLFTAQSPAQENPFFFVVMGMLILYFGQHYQLQCELRKKS